MDNSCVRQSPQVSALMIAREHHEYWCAQHDHRLEFLGDDHLTRRSAQMLSRKIVENRQDHFQ
ncbi:hypothetical protein CO683_38005 [Bradyrhizobium ottawaense]|nr:hypothetical protein CO683_38005 [Bradyrhizobium ottawaense]